MWKFVPSSMDFMILEHLRGHYILMNLKVEFKDTEERAAFELIKGSG